MDTGISSSEACQTHSLTQEDFARMCNKDGSLKNQSTTTFTLKDDPSKTVTISSTALYISGAVLVLIAVCAVVLFVKRRRAIKR